jgi:hypothetical protein
MEGQVYTVQPQPPIEQHTMWFAGSALRIGVEYRFIDADALIATYADDAGAIAEIAASKAGPDFTDAGVSIHVCGEQDGHEYLRFDMFEAEPHYHYVWPEGDHNHVVPFDAAACGDVLEFTLSCLRHRLPAMLRKAHGTTVADQLDPVALVPLVEQVEELVRRSTATRRSAVA